MAKISLERLSVLDKDFLLTTKEVAAVVGCCVATVSKHRHAGLLPWVPGSPVRHRVADVRVYARMLSNGVAKQLHRTLHIGYEDRAIYSPLQSVNGFLEGSTTKGIIEAVIKETDDLWKKHKKERDAAKLASKKK